MPSRTYIQMALDENRAGKLPMNESTVRLFEPDSAVILIDSVISKSSASGWISILMGIVTVSAAAADVLKRSTSIKMLMLLNCLHFPSFIAFTCFLLVN